MDMIRWLNNHKILYWVPLAAVVSVILFFSIIPRPFEAITGEEGSFLDDLNLFDALHAAAYFALCFFMGVAFRHSDGIFRNNHYALAISFSLIFGGAIEIVQGFIPGRYLSFYDVMFNLAGIIPAQIIRYFLKKEKRYLDKII